MASRLGRTVNLFAVTVLLLSLGPFSSSQKKDVLGWENSRWGMTHKDLLAVFGSRLRKLPKRQEFFHLYVDYAIPIGLDALMYTVFFQMGDGTDKLSQVLVRLNEMKSRAPREDIFNALASSLVREYGEPTAKTQDRYRFSTSFNGLSLSNTWRFPTTTVELSYGWDDQIFASTLTIRYFRTT